MKMVIVSALALLVSGTAFAADCSRDIGSNVEDRGATGSGIRMPICGARPVSKPQVPAVNNCKNAGDKAALSNYLNGEKDWRTPPKCYTPAKTFVKAKSWATCSKLEKVQVSKYLSANKASDRGTLPACYK